MYLVHKSIINNREANMTHTFKGKIYLDKLYREEKRSRFVQSYK